MNTPEEPCPACQGSGAVKEKEESYSYSDMEMCDACKATGEKKEDVK